MTLANGADAAVIVGVVVAVLVYLFNRKRAAGSDVLAAMNNLRDEMQTAMNNLRDEMQTSMNNLRDEVRRDVGRLETEVKELRTEVAGIDRRLVAVETTLSTMRLTGALTPVIQAAEPDQP